MSKLILKIMKILIFIISAALLCAGCIGPELSSTKLPEIADWGSSSPAICFLSSNDCVLISKNLNRGGFVYDCKTGNKVFYTHNKIYGIYNNRYILVGDPAVWDTKTQKEYKLPPGSVMDMAAALDKNGDLKNAVADKKGKRDPYYFKNYSYYVKLVYFDKKRKSNDQVDVSIYRTGEETPVFTTQLPKVQYNYVTLTKGDQVIVVDTNNRQNPDLTINTGTGLIINKHTESYQTELFKEPVDDYKIIKFRDFSKISSSYGFKPGPVPVPEGYEIAATSSDGAICLGKNKDTKMLEVFTVKNIRHFNEQLSTYKNKRNKIIMVSAGIFVLIAILWFVSGRSKNNKHITVQNKTGDKKKPASQKPVTKTKEEKIPEESMEQMYISASFAASQGDNTKLDSYLRKGVDINTIDDYGDTLLMNAVDGKQYNTAAHLLEKGANPDLRGLEKKPPLVDAASRSGDTRFIEMLLEYGADVNITDEYGYTALHYAARYMFTELTELLLKNGADPNIKSDTGIAPINGEAACYPDILRALLEAGADPLNKGSDGKTALMDAAEGNSVESAEILITAGVDPDAADANGNRAIDYAKQKKNTIVVEYLEKYSSPAAGGLNSSMLPEDLGMPGSVRADSEKPDIDKLVRSMGFKDFDQFNECFKLSSTDFTEGANEEIIKIIGEPASQYEKTMYHYFSEGLFCYTVKSASHDYNNERRRVSYNYLEGIYFILIDQNKEYIEIIHFKWTDNITAQALDITNVTRKDDGWDKYELYEGYIKNVVTRWLSWNNGNAD